MVQTFTFWKEFHFMINDTTLLTQIIVKHTWKLDFSLVGCQYLKHKNPMETEDVKNKLEKSVK